MNDTHDALPLLAQRFMSLAKGTLVTVHLTSGTTLHGQTAEVIDFRVVVLQPQISTIACSCFDVLAIFGDADLTRHIPNVANLVVV